MEVECMAGMICLNIHTLINWSMHILICLSIRILIYWCIRILKVE